MGALHSSCASRAATRRLVPPLEATVGAERARAVMTFKQGDHYTALYPAVLEKRGRIEAIARRYGARW